MMQPFSVKDLRKRDFKPEYGANGYCRRSKSKKKLDECPLERKIEIFHIYPNQEGGLKIEYIKSMPGSIGNGMKIETIEIGPDGYPKGKISEDACMALFDCSYPIVPAAADNVGTDNTLNRPCLAPVFADVDDGKEIGLKSNWNAGEY